MLTSCCDMLIACHKMLTCSCDEIRLVWKDLRVCGCSRVWRRWRKVNVVQLVVVSGLVVDDDVLVNILIDREMFLLVASQAGGELSPG